MLERIVFFCLSALLLVRSGLAPAASAPDDAPTEGGVFMHNIARLVDIRSRAYRFADEVGIARGGQPKLSREQNNTLRRLGLEYLEARSRLLPATERVAPLFLYPETLRLDDTRPTQTLPRLAHAAETDGALVQLTVNPRDVAGRRLLLDIQRGLAAGMVLMDSYRIAVEPYVANSDFRYLLTYDVGTQHSLRRLTSNYHAPEIRARLAHGSRFVDRYMSWLRDHQLAPDDEEAALYALTQSTLWYGEVRNVGIADLAGTLLYLGGDIELRGKHARQMLSHGLSMGFGNLVGLVQTRRGRLAHMPQADRDRLAAELRPLDILLEKTPFRLTDKLIPGHYGHVAIWLGSEADLRELGVWDRMPAAVQQKVRSGGRIIEALRGGVTLSPLDRFLNIDDLLVLRDQRPLDAAYRREAALTALAQLGKEYDFNFDVYTDQRIVCSELAYVVFPDVPWPLGRTLGRYTISPDNVAQMAIGAQAPFAPAVLYRDGKRREQDVQQALASLLRRPVEVAGP